MGEDSKALLPLQKRFEYEALRRAVKQAGDMQTLRERCLEVIDVMERQQVMTMEMLRKGWLGEG